MTRPRTTHPSPGPNPALVVRTVRGMGRGVFAGRALRAGEIIEVCPVVVLDAGTDEGDLGILKRYVFKWGGRLAIALGYGSLYNHAADPNAAFTTRIRRSEVVYRAVRPIAAGEQVVIDYGWDVADYAAFR